jgi:molecular chaperone GrpE
MTGRGRGLVVAVALLPALVVAVLVLIQGSQLSLPAPPPSHGRQVQVSQSPSALKVVVSSPSLSDRVSVERSARSDALRSGWIAVALLVVIGVAMAWLLAGELRSQRRTGRPVVAPPPAASNGAGAHDARDRGLLVNACIEIGDLVPSESLRLRLREALHAAGVDALEADPGVRFDAAAYRVVDRVATTDPGLHNRIAATERAGYVDRGRRIREPEVLVYSLHVQGESDA